LVGHFTESACLYIDEQRVDITPVVRRLERIPDTVKRVIKNTVHIDVQGTVFLSGLQIERYSELIFLQFGFDRRVFGKQNLIFGGYRLRGLDGIATEKNRCQGNNDNTDEPSREGHINITHTVQVS
jgi:hypothetical protein